MRKPKLRELLEAVKSLFSRPYTTKFPAAPYEPPEVFRGKPKYDEDECIGCTACARVCPSRCIEVTDVADVVPPMRRLEIRTDACIFCGQCELNCTTEKGIRLSTEYDLATFDRATCREVVEKELLLCDLCGCVIGARDHLLWIAERIGAKRYANPTLILVAEGQLKILRPATPRDPAQPIGRDDIMRVLCPRCRSAIVLREDWG